MMGSHGWNGFMMHLLTIALSRLLFLVWQLVRHESHGLATSNALLDSRVNSWQTEQLPAYWDCECFSDPVEAMPTLLQTSLSHRVLTCLSGQCFRRPADGKSTSIFESGTTIQVPPYRYRHTCSVTGRVSGSDRFLERKSRVAFRFSSFPFSEEMVHRLQCHW